MTFRGYQGDQEVWQDVAVRRSIVSHLSSLSDGWLEDLRRGLKDHVLVDAHVKDARLIYGREVEADAHIIGIRLKRSAT